MYSMTGYGRAEYLENGINLLVELKTVNNRNFDLNCKIPRSFLVFEDLIRKEVQKFVKRGRIDLFVNFSDNREKQVGLEVNLEKVVGYYEASKAIAEKLSMPNDFTVSQAMKLPEVISDNSVADVT